MPASGKMTVSKELAKLTGYRIFYNHLVVDLVKSLFDYGTKPFIDLREELWIKGFKVASKYKLSGLIFSFVFEKTITENFIANIENSLGPEDSLLFVELKCDTQELINRVSDNSRQYFGKLTNPNKLVNLIESGVCFIPELDREVLKIDNTNVSPEDVARIIYDNLDLKA